MSSRTTWLSSGKLHVFWFGTCFPFFFWQCQHITVQQIQDRPFPVQIREKMMLCFNLLLHHVV